MKYMVDFCRNGFITVGKLYPVVKHSLGVDAVYCEGMTYNAEVLDLLVEIDE